MAGDRLIRTVTDAQAAGQVSLHFADGAVAAAIDAAAPLEAAPAPAISAPSRPARKPRDTVEGGQQDLFS